MQEYPPRRERAPRDPREQRAMREQREQRAMREQRDPRERAQREPRPVREQRQVPGAQRPAGPRPGANSAAAGRRAALRQKSKQLNVAIAALSAVLVVCLAVALFLPGFLRVDTPTASLGMPDLGQNDYNKDENALSPDDLQGTILSETEDAGEEYVKESLFIGDSNTVRMMHYHDITNVTLENGIGVERMGIDGLTNFKCVSFKGVSGLVDIPAAVKMMQPRRIVVMLGTNNASGTNTQAFIAKYETGINALHEAYPYSDIIFASIPPIAQQQVGNASMATIDEYNKALAELAEKMGYKFLNWSEVLKDPSTGLSQKGYLLDDGIHLNQAAMKVMFQYFRTHSYVTEDTRPQPLEAVPERAETPPGLIASDPIAGSGSSSKTTSSNSSSSSSAAGGVRVVFRVTTPAGVAMGGSISAGGQVGESFTLQVAPKGVVPDAVAKPNQGYKFLYWRCSHGSISNPSSLTLSGFSVYGTLKAGDTLEIVAVFEIEEAPSSSAAPPPPPSSSSTPPPPPSSSSTPPPPSSSSSEEPPVSVPTPPAGGEGEGG